LPGAVGATEELGDFSSHHAGMSGYVPADLWPASILDAPPVVRRDGGAIRAAEMEGALWLVHDERGPSSCSTRMRRASRKLGYPIRDPPGSLRGREDAGSPATIAGAPRG
jgi:hypothetical protein